MPHFSLDHQDSFESISNHSFRSRRSSGSRNQLTEHPSYAEFDDLLETLSHRNTSKNAHLDLKSPHFDVERYAQHVLISSQASGIKARHAGVIFRNLEVIGTGPEVDFQATVSTALTSPLRIFETICALRNPPLKTLLQEFNGVVREGEMLLVLGRPGAGCSTFLKALSGETSGYRNVNGDIHYHGIRQSAMKSQYKGEILYNAETDVHFPTLTVAQTLEFSATCRAPQRRIIGETREQHIQTTKDMLGRVFGLTDKFATKVGNDYIRGVSGGERKRVSIAEALSSRAAIQCWDNSTRGLDSSTALEFVQAIRLSTNLHKTTAIFALYQVGEQIYDLFDKVTVIYDGHQIYFGRATEAKEYFEDMGFVCLPRQTTSDFFTSITDPNSRIVKKGLESYIPHTPEDFVKRWHVSLLYKLLKRDMQMYDNEYPVGKSAAVDQWRNSTKQEKAKNIKTSSPYTINFRMQLTACLKRSYQRMWGDKAFLFSSVLSSIFLSLIMGSVFFKTASDTSGFFSKGGVMFFAIMNNSLQGMSDIATMYVQRPVITKHKAAALYYPSADALSQNIAVIPVKILALTIFNVILYFMTGLQRTAGQFFIFYIFIITVTLAMNSMFRLIASVTKTIEQALSIAGIVVIAFVIYAGYVIPEPIYFKWISCVNPIAYAFEGLMTNEFHNTQVPCAMLIPSGPDYESKGLSNKVCPVNGAVPGVSTVSGDEYLKVSMNYSHDHLWRNLIIIVAYWLGFLALNLIAVEFMSPNNEAGEVLVFGHKKALETAKTSEPSAVHDPELGKSSPTVLGRRRTIYSTEVTEEMRKVLQGNGTVTWQHINYDIQVEGTTRHLLDDVQGYVKPGSLTALMGESGAGKTTLLNVLAQRIEAGVVSGDILVNGKCLGPAFQKQCGYVQQQDVHTAQNTIREALRFSAMLRQPASVSRKEKYQYVEAIIKLLEMQDYAEAIIGKPGKGLNVEQRKRLTIGVELAAKPKLLVFLDEPTSGLDSQSAWSIVALMKKLARAGQAVLCTIHQPSAALFEQFDRLLLLQKGGQTVYFGNIGKDSCDVINYFERNGADRCPPRANPAEYILEVIGAGATAIASKAWDQVWKNSQAFDEVATEITGLNTELCNQSFDASESSPYAMPFTTQLGYVAKRTFQVYWRSPIYIGSKTFLNVTSGLFIGFTFFGQGNSVASLQNKLFAIFMSTILSASLMNQLVPQFIEIRSLFEVREKPSKTYSWWAFALSAMVVEIPYQIVTGTLYFVCWYWTVGFQRTIPDAFSRGWYMWLMMMLFELYFTTFGQAVAAAAPNTQTASILTTLLFSFVLIFNGVMQPPSKLVRFWQWMYKVSPFTYLIESMMTNVVHGVQVRCRSMELNIIQPPAGQTCGEYLDLFISMVQSGSVYNPADTSNCEFCRYGSSDEYLSTIGMSFNHRWQNVAILAGYITFNIFATILLFYIFQVHQWNKETRADSRKKISEKSANTDETPFAVLLRQTNPSHAIANEKDVAP
ncbi:Brefeldin A resistance protein [Neolecta irregularis DAH-3]|uniref:Brefeldin A resistance protein n=1 Tax=Neolecta irregularis (strain DAH-3) TaxID=1198029 RepID=A0A1U7LUH5_NEOID|nr:Brefeldin A resistance protein [Neolecta irregularis DAH-3]|eukprot:OLL26317.1 Brefeldin A resistance protein [Neolecta irregularis DAH-3]